MNTNLMTPVIIIAFETVILLGLLLFLLFKNNSLKKSIKRLIKNREKDLLETNKLLIEKSDNDTSVLLQLETVLEEIIKMLRRTKINEKDIIKNLEETKALVQFLVNKEHDK